MTGETKDRAKWIPLNLLRTTWLGLREVLGNYNDGRG